MKVNKISRRAFLLGLGAVSTAALLRPRRQRILLFCRFRLCCIRQCRSCGQ